MKKLLLLALLLLWTPALWAQGANQCLMPRPLPSLLCEEGGEFLCVNTAPGSRKENFIQLYGRLNLEDSDLGTFAVTVQHEYTRDVKTVDLSEPLEEDCWERALTPEENFCLEANGKFSAYVSLPDLGPYAISVSASPVDGSGIQKSVRTSFVIAPALAPDALTLDPDVRRGSVGAETTHVHLTVDLLKECSPRETCDFIGSITGGVRVSVQNYIQREGREVSVRCATNVTQGGAGLFEIGVPVLPGSNQINMEICNAADCLEWESSSFRAAGEPAAIEVLSPAGTAPLRFRVRGFSPAACDDKVQVSWNFQPSRPVCADDQGVFESRPSLKPGLNIAYLKVDLGNQILEETWPVANGPVLSPFDASGALRPEAQRRLHDALQIHLSRRWLNGEFLEKLNDTLGSRAFRENLQTFTETAGRSPREGQGPSGLQSEIQEQLGFCPPAGDLGDLRVKIMETPKIDSIALEPFVFENQKLKMKLSARDVEFKLQLYKDADGDARPDVEPLPLKMAFAAVEMEPQLEVTSLRGFPLFLKLTSPYTDCDYKREGACWGFPALLVPRRFEGNAHRSGAFVTCDSSQGVSGEMREFCHALNVIDRQTGGVVQEKILDVVNKTFACDAAAALNAGARDGFPFEVSQTLFDLAGQAGLEAVRIDADGIGLNFFTAFGSEDDFENTPETLRSPRVGVLIPSERFPLQETAPNGIAVDVGLALLGQMAWGMESKIVLDEAFFEERDFDFETECNAGLHEGEEGWESSPLCNIRPRAREILGQVVTDYGYLEPDAPLRIRVAPSAAFPLHLDVLDSGRKLAVALADWEMTIASGKQPLITGRLSALLTLSISELELPADDPDNMILTVQTVLEESILWLVPVEESNHTVIPGSLLLTDLEDKLKLAIDNFAQEGKEIKIPIPRDLVFPSDSLFSKMGLSELTWGPEGFVLDWNVSQNRLELLLKPIFKDR